MLGFPTGQLLYGLLYALLGVGFWAAGFVVAYYLYKRWRGEDGPRSEE
ncbi:hypothetical protein [Halorubrum sp. DTA98]